MSRLGATQDPLEIFDKETLVRKHESIAQWDAYLTANYTHIGTVSLRNRVPSATSASLQGLRPIRLTDLNVDHFHRGCVLFGTLCVDPFEFDGAMTVLEDDQGLAIRVGIYNVPASESTPAALRATYPRGAKVAIKEPYFKQTLDGGLAIRVNNTENLFTVTEEILADNNPQLDLKEESGKGKECFVRQNWRGAIFHYTNCIRASNDGEAAKQTRMLAYSNRAEMYLRMGEFERALEDSNQGMLIEPGHLKTMVRKGRALQGLKYYAEACQVLQAALQVSPGEASIEVALRQSRASCARNREGEYDISGFLLRTRRPPPKVGDFIGDVEIKMTRDGRGRGLYATKKHSTGELLLVSNAVAIDGQGFRPSEFYRRHTNDASSEQNILVDAVVGAIKNSQKLQQQLYALDDGSEQVRASAAAVNLFDAYGLETTEMPALQIDKQRIRDIVSRNSLGGRAEISATDEGFSGLWLLPSFINHSCIPNSTRLNVGKAMFLHAAKPIDKGEEITISYFDSLAPLPQREAMCEARGFKCNCMRCEREKPLKGSFENLNGQFAELQERALQETNEARSSGEEFPADLPISGKFAEVYETMEKKLLTYSKMKDKEKQWIRASYVIAYWAGTQANEFYEKALNDPIPSSHEILHAVVNTVPGDLRALAMAARELESSKHGVANRGCTVEISATEARNACVRVFGKQTENVIQALIQRNANTATF